jgi:hypothetical protein
MYRIRGIGPRDDGVQVADDLPLRKQALDGFGVVEGERTQERRGVSRAGVMSQCETA